jgi:hypothetical protein
MIRLKSKNAGFTYRFHQWNGVEENLPHWVDGDLLKGAKFGDYFILRFDRACTRVSAEHVAKYYEVVNI